MLAPGDESSNPAASPERITDGRERVFDQRDRRVLDRGYRRCDQVRRQPGLADPAQPGLVRGHRDARPHRGRALSLPGHREGRLPARRAARLTCAARHATRSRGPVRAAPRTGTAAGAGSTGGRPPSHRSRWRLGSKGGGETERLMDEGQGGGLMAPQRRALTVGLVLTITFVASEALAVVTVMPVVARDLGGLRLYGWVFSGFMLGSVIGIVAAGREADRRGPALPFVAGVVLFGSGLAVAGLAPSMGVLVAGRVLQGIGAGAVPSVAYVAIGRSLPGPLRARMMAVLSTAWVAPGLIGPAVSAEVARLFGWRWVFLGLLPIVAVAGAIAVPALVRLGPPASAGAEEHRMIDGFRTAAGATMILAGLTLSAGAGAGPGRLTAALG